MKRGWVIVLVAVLFNLFMVMQVAAEVTTSINGEYRLRPEYKDNADFDKADDDAKSFYGQRVRLGVNANINTDLSAFVQVQDTRNWGWGDVLTDSGQALDFHQAYVTLKNIKGLPLSLKVGRQELNYGDQRLIGGFGWSNQGRAFDAIKLTYAHDIADIDFWTAKVTENNSYRAGDGGDPDQDTDFYGLYATIKSNPIPDSNLQAYLLLKRDGGAADLTEYTLGGRLAGKVSGIGVDYTAELAYQFGDSGDSDISASALAVEAGYAIPNMTWSPRVAVEYDMASGDDDSTDDEVNTFDNLYPTNHLHYGYMDYQGWANMNDIALKVSAKPTDKCFVYLAYHMFSLAEDADAWYGADGLAKPVFPGGIGEDKVGQEIDLVAKHTFNQNLKVEAGASQFFAGDFIKNAASVSDQDDSTWAYLMGTVSF